MVVRAERKCGRKRVDSEMNSQREYELDADADNICADDGDEERDRAFRIKGVSRFESR